MSITISIVHLAEWKEIEPYLVVDRYDRDGGHADPRIRIGFDGLPESMGRRLIFTTMPCVTCQRPIYPLRRRHGDPWSRLYYAPCCPISVRVSCSRGRAAELEYERFKSIESSGAKVQTSLPF